MNQLIATYLIIILAIVYTFYAIIKSLMAKPANGCGDSCSCSAKSDIGRAIKRKQLKVIR